CPSSERGYGLPCTEARVPFRSRGHYGGIGRMASLARAFPTRFAADFIYRLERHRLYPSMTEELSMSRQEDIHSRFATAFNSANLDAVMALYEPEASLVPQPRQVVRGHNAIRQALVQFMALKGTMQVKSVFTVHGPGVALMRGQWKLTGI